MFAPNVLGNGSPSFSHLNIRGESPRETPQTVRVRIPSARPSWKENGSIMGGTGPVNKESERREKKRKKKNRKSEK